MAMNKHAATLGTTLSYATITAPDGAHTIGAYTALTASIKELSEMPKDAVDEYDITRIDQANAYKQFAAGLIDPGSLKVKLGFDHTLIAAFRGFAAGVLYSWKITFSDAGTTASTLVFDGWVKEQAFAPQAGNEVAYDLTIRVSGPPVFTAGT